MSDSKEKEQILRELEVINDQVQSASSLQFFLPLAYRFSRAVANSFLLKPILKKIEGQCEEDHANYHAILEKIWKRQAFCHKSIAKYVKSKGLSNSQVDNILSFFLQYKEKHIAFIYHRTHAIKVAAKVLLASGNEHYKFLRKLELLDDTGQVDENLFSSDIEALLEECHCMSRIRKASVWGSYKVVGSFHNIYYPKITKAVQEFLHENDRASESLLLDYQSKALAKVIDSGGDPERYADNFDMERGKYCINDFFQYIKLELSKRSVRKKESLRLTQKDVEIKKPDKFKEACLVRIKEEWTEKVITGRRFITLDEVTKDIAKKVKFATIWNRFDCAVKNGIPEKKDLLEDKERRQVRAAVKGVNDRLEDLLGIENFLVYDNTCDLVFINPDHMA